MPKTGHAAEPRHIAYLLSKNMEAAHLFAHLDPEAAIQDFDNRVADGYPIGAIVDRWKRTPPHPGAIYERRPAAPNRPRRSAAAPAPEPLDDAAIRAKIKPVTIDDW